ncbi:MAG TPA: hypothetical protein DCS97_02035 [Planctomycetes bacterium]|nr:hypothetical protein [Planctomycetota bacterium]
MIRRTVTASALFLALSTNGGDPLVEDSNRRTASNLLPGQSLGHQQAITGWTQRWEGQRCWITTPERGEHQAIWFRTGTDPTAGDPAILLDGFISDFAASASTPSVLAGFAAERVIGKGISPDGVPQIGVAVLAPTPTGTLILASRGGDAELPGRFRDLLVLSTLV